ncbi:hypothetical protein FRC00_010635 [Tulasnella sp. 408]|nr:hypothetical protein FRC00_010635 [Tulasnella sp. 408]
MHKDASAKPDFRTLEGWNAINGDGFIASGKRYITSKLANILFVKELQSRLDAEKLPITCLAINPGLVNTGSHEKAVPAGIIAILMMWFAKNFGLTSEQGSFASLFAATSPEIKALPEKWKGAYVEPYNRLTEVSAYGNDKQLAKDLWACSEEVTEACLRDS